MRRLGASAHEAGVGRERIIAGVAPQDPVAVAARPGAFAWRILTARFSSSLTRRIVVLNLGGLVVLMIGFLLLNQFRADIIAAREQSLTTQADIIAAAVAASAGVDTDSITIDPDKLLQLAPGQTAAPSQSDEEAIQFSINPERVGPVLHRLVTPTHTRARIYDSDGRLLLDSRSLSAHGAVVRSDLPDPPSAAGCWTGLPASSRNFFATPSAPRPENPWLVDGKSVPEVAAALHGKTEVAARINNEGETIVSVAVPIQYMMATRGALQLSTQGGDIDRVIASERWAIFRFFVVLASVMLVLSLSLANTIAEPVRRLATAAERVRRGIRSRQQIPDFTSRTDEIGHLSRALREMTMALYSRLDAIESFAADVAHELKNPLTSLRSALETLPRVHAGPVARSPDRGHAARRPAPRPADLGHFRRFAPRRRACARRSGPGRRRSAPEDGRVDGAGFAARQRHADRAVGRERGAAAVRSADFLVLGHDSRLAQVVTNLIDNACSFSEPGGTVRVSLARAADLVGGRDAGRAGRDHGRRRRSRHSRRMRSNGSSSGSTLIAQVRDSARIPGSGFRSRGRSSKPTADESGRGTGRPRRTRRGGRRLREPARHGAGARFVVELPAFSP